MPLPGPFLLVAKTLAPGLRAAIASTGAFPLVDALPSEAAAAIETVKPTAILVVEPDVGLDDVTVSAIARHSGTSAMPLVPVIALIADNRKIPIAGALPIRTDTTVERIVARLAAAHRVRTLHANVLHRAEMIAAEGEYVPPLSISDPMEDATVLVAGRGRSYPQLAVAIGERAGLIGALSIETAARCLANREVNGIVIGDGFDPQHVEALLTVVAEDARFRDLPVTALNGVPTKIEIGLSNFERISGDAEMLVRRFLPYVRLHAFMARLKRFRDALDSKGIVNPDNGLLIVDAFAQLLASTIDDAREQASALSIAHFSFPADCDRRVLKDAARLVSKLIRGADFACQDDSGSILIAFTETDLRSAHVSACRIASVIKHTAAAPTHDHARVGPMVALAALKPGDTVGSLISQIQSTQKVAAE